jgi:addiction module HigA family antidote
MKKLIQHNPPHPGEILLEFYIEPLSLTVTGAAKKLLITRPNLSAILNGKAGISPLMAAKLSKAFKTTPQYWMNMQSSFDLWQVLKDQKAQIAEVKPLV